MSLFFSFGSLVTVYGVLVHGGTTSTLFTPVGPVTKPPPRPSWDPTTFLYWNRLRVVQSFPVVRRLVVLPVSTVFRVGFRVSLFLPEPRNVRSLKGDPLSREF